MIDPKELRLGNYVLVNGTGYSHGQEVRLKLPKKVEGIRIFENGDAFAYFDNDRISCLSIRPISITDEIILECGFGEVGMYDNVYHKGDLRLYLNKEANQSLLKYEKQNNNLEVEISNVHQLQNLYYFLTGQELQINL